MVNNPNHHRPSSGSSIDHLRGGGDGDGSVGNHTEKQFTSTTSNDHDPVSNLKNYTAYELWVRRLYATNLFHPVKLGLENMLQLHEAIGNPMDHTCVVHIAGTNGKGSVALKIAKALQYSGCKVGLFCSPHVSSFRDRKSVV